MQCIQCNKEFKSTRSTAKYCSSNCRVKSLRGVSVTKVSVTDLSVTSGTVDTPDLHSTPDKNGYTIDSLMKKFVEDNEAGSTWDLELIRDNQMRTRETMGEYFIPVRYGNH